MKLSQIQQSIPYARFTGVVQEKQSNSTATESPTVRWRVKGRTTQRVSQLLVEKWGKRLLRAWKGTSSEGPSLPRGSQIDHATEIITVEDRKFIKDSLIKDGHQSEGSDACEAEWAEDDRVYDDAEEFGHMA